MLDLNRFKYVICMYVGKYICKYDDAVLGIKYA